jgi:lipopolysaccharide export LptBFGC system permease protein LptF
MGLELEEHTVFACSAMVIPYTCNLAKAGKMPHVFVCLFVCFVSLFLCFLTARLNSNIVQILYRIITYISVRVLNAISDVHLFHKFLPPLFVALEVIQLFYDWLWLD